MKHILSSLCALGVSASLAHAVNVSVDNPVTLADSIADFAVAFPGGEAGANGWNYGYYNYTTDGDNTYTSGEFTPFTTGQVRAGGYGLAPSNAPWTLVDANNAGHPNGTNSAPNEEHWAIRRYNAGTTGNFDLNWVLSSQNGVNTGTTMRVYQNGVEVVNSGPVTTTGGTSGTVNLNVNAGDVIDFALTPEGTGGDRVDGSDGSFFGGRIVSPNTLTFEGVEIANSRTDWSGTDVQGTNGWTYGYYNLGTAGSASFTGSLNPNDLVEFDPGSQWTGSGWDFVGNPPWTFIAEEQGHPNGTNNVDEHWATRRYEVQPGEEGEIAIVWDLSAENLNGTGTSIHVLLNGVEVDFEAIAGNDGTGIQRGVIISGAEAGDLIDISLSPEGITGDLGDGADGSLFGATIYQVIPEPSAPLLIGLAGLGLLARRRRR